MRNLLDRSRVRTITVDIEEDGMYGSSNPRADRFKLSKHDCLEIARANGFDSYSDNKNIKNFMDHHMNERVKINTLNFKIVGAEYKGMENRYSRLDQID